MISPSFDPPAPAAAPVRTQSRRRRRAERRKRRLLWWLWPGLMAGASLVVLAGWFWPQGGAAPLQAAAPTAAAPAEPALPSAAPALPVPAPRPLPAPPAAPTAPAPVAGAAHASGLPAYPGAGPVQAEGMAPAEPGLDGGAQTLQTTDSAQLVLNFYRQQLGASGRPAEETKGNGDQWLLVEAGVTNGRQRRVLIEGDVEHTRITVVSLPAGTAP